MHMVRFLFLCALATVAAACSGGSDYTVPPKQAPALWQVEDTESGGRAYIMGSVHMLPDGLNWATPKIRKAAGESDRLITEIGGNAVPDGLFDAIKSDEAVEPLTRRLDAAMMARADMLASGAGVTEEDLDATESWAVAFILTQAQSADLGLSTDLGVEAQLRALIAGKPVVGLETAAVQMDRFDALSAAEQQMMLRLSLRPTDARADFQTMMTAWLSGDLAALEAQLTGGMMADPALRTALLTKPNAQWAGQIAKHIRAGHRPFIAIGSAHLLGRDSVLALLNADGMTVTRLQ